MRAQTEKRAAEKASIYVENTMYKHGQNVGRNLDGKDHLMRSLMEMRNMLLDYGEKGSLL